MALECPNGHGRQNVLANITADGLPPKKAKDVIAKRLACGCVVGGKDYENFLKSVHDIEVEQAAAIEKIREAAKHKKSAAYQAMLTAQEA